MAVEGQSIAGRPDGEPTSGILKPGGRSLDTASSALPTVVPKDTVFFTPERAKAQKEPNPGALRATIHSEQGSITHDFQLVTWYGSDTRRNILTTAPSFTERMMYEGPDTSGVIADDEVVSVTIAELPRGDVDLDGIARVSTVDFHGPDRAIYLHEPQDGATIHPVAGALGEPKHIPDPHVYYDLSSETYDGVSLGYKKSGLTDTISAVATVFKAVGFGEEEGTKKIPFPDAFFQRVDDLRESDVTSGIFYPPLRPVDAAHIDPHTYLESYAAGEHPVATGNFFYYDHDAASEHMVGFMVYGEMLMDLTQKFAQARLDAVEDASADMAYGEDAAANEARLLLEESAGAIDVLTDYLGGSGFRADYEIDTIAASLFEANMLDETKIVHWMREQDIVGPAEIVTGSMIMEGLQAYATDRFGVDVSEVY